MLRNIQLTQKKEAFKKNKKQKTNGENRKLKKVDLNSSIPLIMQFISKHANQKIRKREARLNYMLSVRDLLTLNIKTNKQIGS